MFNKECMVVEALVKSYYWYQTKKSEKNTAL